MNSTTLSLLVALTVPVLAPVAQAQQFPLALTHAQLAGPGGDFLSPVARVGETVDLHVGVWNFSGTFNSVTVNAVSVVIHHGSGDVVIENLLAGPVTLYTFGERAVFSTNFIAQPGDPEFLEVEYTVTGTYNADGEEGFGVPGGFTTRFGAQIRIMPSAPPVLAISRDGYGGVRVRWPASAAGFQLEQSSGFGGNWTAVDKSPAMADGAFSVTLGASKACQFYRLVKP